MRSFCGELWLAKALPSPCQIPAHISGGKKSSEKKTGMVGGNECIRSSPSWLLTYSNYSYSSFASNCFSTSGNKKS